MFSRFLDYIRKGDEEDEEDEQGKRGGKQYPDGKRDQGYHKTDPKSNAKADTASTGMS